MAEFREPQGKEACATANVQHTLRCWSSEPRKQVEPRLALFVAD
jgi:hypothetical protein